MRRRAALGVLMDGLCKSGSQIMLKAIPANEISFVGAEDGIYEFPVNLVQRRLFPGITLR